MQINWKKKELKLGRRLFFLRVLFALSMAMKKKLCFFFGMFYIIFVFTSSLHPSIIIITFLVKAALRASGHTFSPLCENQRACVFDIFTQPSRQCWSKQEKKEKKMKKIFLLILSLLANEPIMIVVTRHTADTQAVSDLRTRLVISSLCSVIASTSQIRHNRVFFTIHRTQRSSQSVNVDGEGKQSNSNEESLAFLVGGARNCDFKVHSHIRGAHIRWRWRRDYRVSLRDGWLDRKHFISEMWIIAAWNSRRDLISWLFFLVFIRFRAHILPAISVEVLRVYWIFSSLRALALKSNLNSSWWGW